MMPLVKLMIFRDDRREMNCSEWVKTHDHKFDGMNWHEYNILYIYTIIYYIYTCRIWPIYQLRIAMKSCNISWENSGWTDPSPFPGFHGFRWVRRHVWSCQKVAVRRSIAATKARRVHGIAGDFVTERMCQWQLASWGFGDLYNQQKWSNNVIWPLEMGI